MHNSYVTFPVVFAVRKIIQREKKEPPTPTNQPLQMRPLTKEELEIFFGKLSKYLGSNIQRLIKRDDEPHCFRLHNDRVYYVSEVLMRQATSIGREELLLIGTCFGKFTKTKKFRLHITCLDQLAQHAKYKVWVKPNAEMSFLYGNHVPRAGLARITESTPQYAGVVVYNMANIPLGFGLASHATEMCRALEPTAHVVLRQADIGEYLREEETLT